MIGIGFGAGRGAFENGEASPFYLAGETQSTYRDGVSPQIRFGRMLGEHFQAGVSYEAWLIEFGVVAPDMPDKVRRTIQNLSFAFALFPGNQRGASGGIFLRAGAGLGWVGTGVKEVPIGAPQDEGEREDEWGVGVFTEGGYEFWIAKHLTAGLGATFNYFDIGDEIVDRAWFGAVVFNVNLYF